jgi:tetratricopeptide (TPR) repeat protein
MVPASESSSRAPAAGALLVATLVSAALVGAAFAGDASGNAGTLPVGGTAVVLLAAALLGMALGWLPLPRAGWSGGVLLSEMVLLVAWTGATVWWSIVADRSWEAFNKSVAYAAFLGLGLVLAAVGRGVAARLAATLLSLVLGATLTWALLAKVVPSLDPDGDRVARLREPVGYWNALALLADVALVLGLWVGTSREHRRPVRVAGGLLVYMATLALMLTLSRAGLVVAVGVLVLWLALSSERVQSGLLLVASALPAAAVGAWAFTRPALTEDVALRADRVADGKVFGVLTVVGALVVVAVLALGLRRSLSDEQRRRAGRWLIATAVVALLAAAVAGSVATADAVTSGRDCTEVVNDPSRFGSLASDRWCWWGEAWDVYAHHSPVGAGAGTFEIARKRFRSDARSVVQPHSVPLQQLADGGIPALALFVVVVLSGIAVCVCALRRLDGAERAAAAALVAAPAAYLCHALVDYSWDFLAVTAPTMVVLGVLAGAGRVEGTRRRRPLVAVAVVLLAATVLVSFSLPRLADSAERSSTRALAAGDFARALDEANRARFFDPVSVDPLYARARVSEARRVPWKAERDYVKAVELQPDNPETWYTLGIFEFDVRGNLCAAYRFLNNAYTLDPSGSQWRDGGPLDVSRAAVNRGGCAPGS